MEVIKIKVKDGGDAAITCPFCMNATSLPVGDYLDAGKRTLKVKCFCSEFFIICLEPRQHPRKGTNLLGQSVNLTNQNEKQDIIVENISLGGIAFCPFKKHQTRKDDQLKVSFLLNDIQNTPIDANVTVRSSTDDQVGCEFNSTEKFRAPLSFFISPGSCDIE